MKIGMLDSGFGGLTVLQYALTHVTNQHFIYYADTDNVPYGEKSTEEVYGFVKNAVDFMIQKGARAIVIACNTATSVAADELRRQYDIPIIGMEPAVKKAVEVCGDKRVLVAATPITVRGEKMHDLIGKVDQHHLVDLVPTPGLVRFAESLCFDTSEVAGYLNEAFRELDLSQYGSMVLGCTHFGYFKDSFAKVLPKGVHFFDGNQGTINQMLRMIGSYEGKIQSPSTAEYYCSGREIQRGSGLQKVEHFLHRAEQMAKIQTI